MVNTNTAIYKGNTICQPKLVSKSKASKMHRRRFVPMFKIKKCLFHIGINIHKPTHCDFFSAIVLRCETGVSNLKVQCTVKSTYKYVGLAQYFENHFCMEKYLLSTQC